MLTASLEGGVYSRWLPLTNWGLVRTWTRAAFGSMGWKGLTEKSSGDGCPWERSPGSSPHFLASHVSAWSDPAMCPASGPAFSLYLHLSCPSLIFSTVEALAGSHDPPYFQTPWHLQHTQDIFPWHSAGRASLILQISAQMLQALWNSLISDVHGHVPSLVCCNHFLYSSYMLGVLNLAHTLRSVHPQHLAPSRCSEIALWMNIYGYFVLF